MFKGPYALGYERAVHLNGLLLRNSNLRKLFLTEVIEKEFLIDLKLLGSHFSSTRQFFSICQSYESLMRLTMDVTIDRLPCSFSLC